MTSPALAPQQSAPWAPLRSWYALAILVVATLLGFLDRQIFVLIVEPLKHDLHLDDFQIGMIQGLGPSLFAVIAGFPIAWAADKIDRKLLMILCIACWAAATAACGLVDSFTGLFLATIAIGIGEAGFIPIVYALIPGLFPGRDRQFANFTYYGLSIMGFGLGLMLGGWALQIADDARLAMPGMWGDLATWRITFILVALPAVPIILAILPIRLAPPAVEAGVSDRASGLGRYLSEHGVTFTAVFVAGGLCSLALVAGVVWLPVAIIRATTADAGTVGIQFGLIYSISAIAGVIAAMATTPLWRRMAGQASALRARAVCSLLSLIPTIGFFFIEGPMVAYLLGGLQYFLVTIGAAYSPALYQDMSPDHLRTRTISMASIITTIVATTGPMVVGLLSDVFGTDPRAPLIALVTVSVPALLISAILFWSCEKRFVALLSSVNAPPAA